MVSKDFVSLTVPRTLCKPLANLQKRAKGNRRERRDFEQKAAKETKIDRELGFGPFIPSWVLHELVSSAHFAVPNNGSNSNYPQRTAKDP
jgi:hypothetical protein